MTRSERIEVLAQTKQRLEAALDTIRTNAFMPEENAIRNTIKAAIVDCAELMGSIAED